MKVGQYISEKRVECIEQNIPTPKSDEVLMKVSYAGICGTDMMIYSGLHPRATAPLTLGHEFSGMIVEGKGGLKAGDKVAVNPLLTCKVCAACLSGQAHVCNQLKLVGIDQDGGFSEYASVPMHCIRKLPSTVNEQEAAMLEPLAVAIHTVRRSTLKMGDTVTILGAGPIGLLIGLVAQKAGAGKIFISDISQMRLKIAKDLGFKAIDAKKDHVIDVVHTYTNGVGADVVFEVAGNQLTAEQMIECIKFQGQIVVVSVFKQPPRLNLAAMHYREIGLTTTRCYSENDFNRAIDLLVSQEMKIDRLISHILPLEEIKKGFELMENPDESLKILFKP